MGVQARLVVYASDEQTAKTACKAAFDRVDALEQIMSDYRPDSEVRKLCAQPEMQAVPISKELMYVLQKSQTLAEESHGAFDVTVGPLVTLWRAARKSGELPKNDPLQEAKQRVGYRFLQLDPDAGTATHALRDMRIDLGGIGKGYAGDEAIATLKAHGIESALFEAGGDIVVSNAPPGQKGWPIQTYRGRLSRPRKVFLANAAVSTSGATEQFVTIDSKTYSHVVDPRTGVGLTNQYLATVIAKKGIDADGLSTAITVLGPTDGRALAKQYGASVYVTRVL